MSDKEPRPELLELPGKQIIRHLVKDIEEYDPAQLANELNHLKSILEDGRKSKAGDVSTHEAIGFIHDVTGPIEISAGILYIATGTHGDRLYLKYDQKKRKGSMYMPYDTKADPTRTSLNNFTHIFGYESCGDPRIWNYTGREGVTIDFQMHDSAVEVIPLEQ